MNKNKSDMQDNKPEYYMWEIILYKHCNKIYNTLKKNCDCNIVECLQRMGLVDRKVNTWKQWRYQWDKSNEHNKQIKDIPKNKRRGDPGLSWVFATFIIVLYQSGFTCISYDACILLGTHTKAKPVKKER